MTDRRADPLALRYAEVVRRRPISLVSTIDRPVLLDAPGSSSDLGLPRPAPCVAVEADLGGDRLVLTLAGRGLELRAVHEAGETWLEVDGTGWRSRRSARSDGSVDGLGLALTGTHVTVLTREGANWTGRARADLLQSRPDVPVRDPSWLAGLRVGHEGPATRLLAGGYGQLGLRDIRLVTHADGRPYERDGLTWLCATSAGPGHFGTGHTSVWSLDRSDLEIQHRADLFFHRPSMPGVFGDHASHLLRDDATWLVATSTWGDLDASQDDARVEVILARSDADLLDGVHVLETEPLDLPTTGRSVGVWDPHLLRTGDGWLVGYVQATRFFRFHPVLAHGPALDALRLTAAARGRRATEGTTLLPRGADVPVVLVSDGRDGRRGEREQWVVMDLDLREMDVLAASYPTNIPWPTLVPDGDGWLLVTFDGTRHGGRVCGYGTHGDLVVLRGS